MLAAGFATTGRSATNSWTGTAGDGLWATSTNWTSGVPNAQGADATITVAGATVDLVNTSETVGALTIGNSTQVTLNSSGTGSLIFNASSGNATLTMATVNSPTVIAAPITLTSSVDVTVGATTSVRYLALNGKISGAGGITLKTGSVGKLQINNSANNFSGGVTIESGGNLYGNGGVYLGTGNLTINNGGTIQTAAGSTVSAGGQIWAGDFTTAIASGGLDMGTSAVSLNGGTRTVTLNNTGAGVRTMTVGGIISNGGLTLSATGSGAIKTTLFLTGANTYASGTMVNASATLATTTTGTFGKGNVTVASGGFLTAGNATSFDDTLATLYFAKTSTAASINLNFTGADTLGAVYDSVTATYLTAGTYTATQLNTYFSSSVFAGTGSLTIAVSSVPEPSSCAAIFGAFALGAVVIVRRRRA